MKGLGNRPSLTLWRCSHLARQFHFFPPLFPRFLPLLCFSTFLPFFPLSLFLLTAQQLSDVLYRPGSVGPQLPNKPPWFISLLQRGCVERLFLCFLLLTASKGPLFVFLSACPVVVSWVMKWLPVMHLARLSWSWSPSVDLSCCFPPRYRDIYYQWWKDCGDWRSQLMVILRFSISPPWLKRKSVLSVSLHPFLTFLYFPLLEKKNQVFFSLPLYGCPVPDGYQTIANPPKDM